ncbi:hypothetical protein FQN57_005087 [Myotisia sp. PD_48]|nr:hypothetical protein FQN57_005087 [Myotisia sp. PD_48]
MRLSMNVSYPNCLAADCWHGTIDGIRIRAEIHSESLDKHGRVFVDRDHITIRIMTPSTKKNKWHVYLSGLDDGMQDIENIFAKSDALACASQARALLLPGRTKTEREADEAQNRYADLAISIPSAAAARQSYDTPLMEASHEGRLPIAPQLLSPSAPEQADSTASTPATCVLEPDTPKVDLWQEALKKLPEKKRRLLSQKWEIGNASPDPLKEKIDKLIELAKKAQKECEEKFCKVNGIPIRDRMVKIIGWVQQTGKIVVEFAPSPAKGIWGVIDALLQVPITEADQMDALLKCLDRVTRAITRGVICEQVCAGDPVPKEAIQNIHKALIKMYSYTLEVLADAIPLFSTNTARRSGHAFLYPKESIELLSKLTASEKDLTNEVITYSASIQTNLMGLIRNLDAPMSRVDEGVQKFLDHIDEMEHIAILEWISPIRHGENHDFVRERRTLETCGWLLCEEKFRSWAEGSSSDVLWLRGSPGAGKTFLTNEPERRKPLNVLKSYVRQLAAPAGKDQIMQISLRQTCKEARRYGSSLNFEKCTRLLLESLNLFPMTTLILDALDECDLESRGKLIQIFDKLVSGSKNPLKIFISSRQDQDIWQRFQARPNIEIQAKNNMEDIEMFIQAEIADLGDTDEVFRRLKDDIIKALLDKCKDMFQWAALQIHHIRECRSEEAIRNRLGKLPVTLKEAYDEIYSGIQNAEENDKILAERAIMWIMSAMTPLDGEELLELIRVGEKNGEMELARPVKEASLLSLCKNLVILDSELKVWRLCHLSVAEYFEKNHQAWLDGADRLAAKNCLLLLNYRPFTGFNSENYYSESLSENYAKRHWYEHTKKLNPEDPEKTVVSLLKRFIGSLTESSIQFRIWYSLDGHFNPVYQRNPVAYMCYRGVYSLLRDWWEDFEIEPYLSSQRVNLLALAVIGRSRELCQLLTRRGWPVDCQTPILGIESERGSPLYHAVDCGNLEMVKCLVQEGATVDLRNSSTSCGTALALAVSQGKISIAEYLIQAKADVDMQTGGSEFGTALAAAQNTEMIKLLLDHGATINLQRQSGSGSALIGATLNADKEAMRLLIQHGAEVDMQCRYGFFGTALIAAAACTIRLEVMELLIQHGAMVNAQCQSGDYGTALIAAAITASRWEKLWYIEALIQHGAMVNMECQYGEYGTALVAAAATPDRKYFYTDPILYGTNAPAVRFLLQHGADPNMECQYGKYGNALISAASNNNLVAAQALVEGGANVNMQCRHGRYKSALAAAIAADAKEIQELLIKRGAKQLDLDGNE